jgi:hypothetical protein
MARGLFLACLALGLVLPSAAWGQTRERVKVTGLRVGFPPGPVRSELSRTGIFKAGQWAPIYVDLECSRDTEEPLVLIVETKDADEIFTEGSVELPAMVKGDRIMGNEMGRLPYLKPGMTSGMFSVRVKGAQTGRTYGELSERYVESLTGAPFVVLGVGMNLSGIRFPTTERGGEEEPAGANVRTLRNGWVETAQITDVGMLPDQWFGYAAVDLLVLGTGANREFWETLGNPQHEKRRKAIAEWVRRGGRLVLSVGTNPDVLEAVKEIRDILPATVPPGGKRAMSQLDFAWQVPGNIPRPKDRIQLTDRKADFAVATLQPRPDRPSRVLVSEESSTRAPVAIQGAHGLGRVTVVAFDLDRAPFADWRAGRGPFWENVVNYCAYQMPPNNIKFEQYSSRFDEYTSGLQGSLDFFESVPVVSFGWVALFILIYIILIGPIDYLFLKKVVKRLEWTWVTFPIIVIAVSAGAYFAAYALKGKDLKTNKVDVVDIDLAGRRIDGHAWFTLFSPRIHNYTIGLEPAGPLDGDSSKPAWTPADPTVAARDTVLSWQSNVERFRASSGGLFSKRYKYQSTIDPLDPNRDLYAVGLEGVPIQVWTTKAFAAQWTAPIDPNKPPVTANLSVSRANENVLTGSITSHLPAERFTDIALIWRGRVLTLADLPPGVEKSISISADQGADRSMQPLSTWANANERLGPGERPWNPTLTTTYGGTFNQGTPTNPTFRLWNVLFNEAAPHSNTGSTPNASLRRLDQSWRVAPHSPEQAILVLRIPTRETPAEEMAQAPDTPSRLWIGALPTAGGKRPALQGTLKQETYIRVFIPVKQSAPPKK